MSKGPDKRVRTLRRVCGATGCSESIPEAGPMPHTWDIHEVPTDKHWRDHLRADTRTVLSCSKACRQKLGLPERKVVASC